LLMVNCKLLIVMVALIFCSCGQNSVSQNTNNNSQLTAEELSEIKEKVAPFFKQMQIQLGDWLESFPENGQTFEQYLTANPTLPTAERKTIYIQPIGEFSETQKKVLQITADYMKAFYNLPVKLNEIKLLGDVPKEFQRKHPVEKQLQIKPAYFLDNLLPKLLPDELRPLS
jgi:hypothetical protein